MGFFGQVSGEEMKGGKGGALLIFYFYFSFAGILQILCIFTQEECRAIQLNCADILMEKNE